jgi:hypothetical protein
VRALTGVVTVCGLWWALLPVAPARAQGRVVPPPTPAEDTIHAAPGPRYEAGSVHRFLLGSGWRDLWQIPLTLPVLRIDTFAGGLTPEREGGNKQSTTLHFEGVGGRDWVFRSVDKYPSEKLSDDVNETPVGSLIQDQISAVHPVGWLLVPPLLKAIGILTIEPMLYVMPDDPKLGEFRERFAGMIGELEEKPNEGPDDSPGFAGSRKVRDTEETIEDLEESSAHVLAERELVRVRLLDFILGDTDRTTDQYSFARFPHPDDPERYLWRPIPRDRDWVFLRADGPGATLARITIFPKFVTFGPAHSSIIAHTFSSHAVDRRLLASIDRMAFNEEVAAVKSLLTDGVIDDALRRLPSSYPESHARWMAEAMRARRDSLDGIASKFYEWLASDVDIHATDEPDRAEVVRYADGRVQVTLERQVVKGVASNSDSGEPENGTHATEPYYRRIFLPSETREVRVFLHGDGDVAVVRGTSGPITIRVIGGGGDDLLADSSSAGGVHFYDHRGDNRFVRGGGTRVDTRAWTTTVPPEGLRIDLAWAPDWGGQNRWTVTTGYGVASGIIVGAGRTWTNYGFRRIPHHWKLEARGLVGTRVHDFGAELSGDYRFENSLHLLRADVRWSNFDGFRWFGLGNDTERIDSRLSLVRMQRLSIEPALEMHFGRWREAPDSAADAEADSASARTLDSSSRLRPLRVSVALGPVLRYTTTDAATESVFAFEQPLGIDPLWQLGAGARLELSRTDGRAAPRRGFRLRTNVMGYPGLVDSPEASAQAEAEANAYIPLQGDGLHIALRAGGSGAFGDFAAFDAASIGGRHSLRGYEFQRWAGDAAAYGGAELRAPLRRVELLVRGELGAFALVDAGKVWLDGASPGGWHAGYGGGLWFESFERAVSVAFATGERNRFYLSLDLPF